MTGRNRARQDEPTKPGQSYGKEDDPRWIMRLLAATDRWCVFMRQSLDD